MIKRNMTEEELWELVKNYVDAHFKMWTEWAACPEKKRHQLSIWDKTSKEFYYNNQEIQNGCFLCKLAGYDCNFCSTKISTFNPPGCYKELFFFTEFHPKTQNKEKAVTAIKIAYSTRPVEEIFENLKPFYAEKPWKPKCYYIDGLEGMIQTITRMWSYKREFDPNYDVTLKNGFYPILNTVSGTWRSGGPDTNNARQGLPWFSKEACDALVKKLNTGEVVF